jgi:hypothetical protein
VRGLAAIVMASLVVAGCRASEGSPPEATVPTAPSTSSTTAPIDVSVIPPVIDEPYLNAVLAALDEVDGEATRLIYRQKKLTPEAVDLLNAIYSDDQTDRQANIWLQSLVEDPGLSGILSDPGVRRSQVDRLISASQVCVFVRVRRDYSKVAVDSTPGPLEYLVLRPLDRSNDPNNRNRTAWMITADGYRDDEAEPSDPCRRT